MPLAGRAAALRLTEKAANEIGLYREARHGRDKPDKPGHDEKENHFQVVGKSLKMLDAFSVRLSG